MSSNHEGDIYRVERRTRFKKFRIFFGFFEDITKKRLVF
jgi:hypothetical protein